MGHGGLGASLKLTARAAPDLAAQAIGAGLVDECHLFVVPIAAGGGTQAFPGRVRLGLELLDEHRFGNGTVHLHYRARRYETARGLAVPPDSGRPAYPTARNPEQSTRIQAIRPSTPS